MLKLFDILGSKLDSKLSELDILEKIGGSKVINNRGCYKTALINYQTGFTIGVFKNRWYINIISIVLLLNVT